MTKLYLAIKIIFKNWLKHSSRNKAAIIAFYTLFSFAPLIFLTVKILKLFFHDELVRNNILVQAGDLIGFEANTLITIFRDNSDPISGISFLTIVFLYSSSVIFSELKSAVNLIWYDNDKYLSNQPRSTAIWIVLKEKFHSLCMAPFIIFLFIINAFLRSLFSYLVDHIDASMKSLFFNLNLIEPLISFLVSSVIFFLLLKYLPKLHARNINYLYTSLIITLFYEIGRWLFGFYIANTELTSMYGSLSSFVVFMIWIFYMSHIFLFGVEILRYLEKGDEE